ncbi:MAG: phosphate ABC transporter substrate-binding protein [Candidatus Zixiibacteriota bacterium]
MKRVITIILAISISLIAIADDDQLVLVGSTTVLPIAQASAEMFMDVNPNADVTVRGGGSGVGIAALIDGTTDIANASRDIKEGEIENARKNGIEPYDNIVAYDGIAIITNPASKVDELTIKQIRDIFSGKITNLSEVGGIDKEIVIVSRDVSSGTFEVFKDLVMEGAPVDDGALRVQSNQAAVTTVKNSKSAISYVGLGYVNSSVKAIIVNDIAPTHVNAATGKYPIVRSLHMYTDGEPKGKTKDFIDYVMSEEGQMLVKQLGYVGVSE